MEKSEPLKPSKTVAVSIGFLPAVGILSGGEVTSSEPKRVERGRAKAQLQAKRLSELAAFRGNLVFEPLQFDETQEDLYITVEKKNGGFSPIDLSELKSAMERISHLKRFVGHDPLEEVCILITDGKLTHDYLAIIVDRIALVNSTKLYQLTSKLLRDPWPALILLLFIEIQENRHEITTFQNIWSVNEVYQWITTSQSMETIGSYEEFFGNEATQQFQKLVNELPLPGGLDETDVRSISFSDLEAKKDSLGFGNYVSGFKRTILHKETNTPLSIAIIGEWGKGKSTFMRFLRNELEIHQPGGEKTNQITDKPYPLVNRAVTVWFDAWQYDSEEKVLAALLQTVAKEIQSHFTPYSWLKYRLILGIKRLFNSWQVAYQFLIHVVIVPIVLLLATFLIFALGPELTSTGWQLGTAIDNLMRESAKIHAGGSFGLLLGILYVVWRNYRHIPLPLGLDLNKIYQEKDHTERLGFLSDFREEFGRRIEQIAAMPSWSLRPVLDSDGTSDKRNTGRLFKLLVLTFKDIGSDLRVLAMGVVNQFRKKGVDAEKEGNRVVVFIDDLDRCRPNKIVDILEAIKVTLDTPGIVFVLGMDERYVKSGIFLRYKDHIETQNKLYGVLKESSDETEDDLNPDDSKTMINMMTDMWPSRYLEKVIQISFRLPDANKDDLRNLVSGLLEVENSIEEKSNDTAAMKKGKTTGEAKQVEMTEKRLYREQLIAEIDRPAVSKFILDATEKIGPEHQHNPRRVKTFVNRCKIGLYLLKLNVPDLIEDDYREAIECFTQWERALINHQQSNIKELEDTHDFWHRHLWTIQKSIFGLPEKVIANIITTPNDQD